jgi:hypothetical protein
LVRRGPELNQLEDDGTPLRLEDMLYPPTTHLAIARARQADILAEAERHRLAAAFRGETPRLRDRLAALLRRSKDPRRETPRVAPAPK